ncbi:acetylcholinesterase, putative [Ixodes scapularis]|uniref:Acetylcholinesterase, putative n=1 Tax=Ixodes scapularis TaxID=6945 RepID=B7Q0T6_IXOSC|nr:acetylcholinesterase, putative [Ixodes scapularis]|eukprot:XP_002408299.1 acetylcholinesterase, putative [Ixodes scapularis]
MAAMWNQVVVTPNYRVGLFGFLNELAVNVSENVAIADQELLFRWVQSYIHLFGGSVKQVILLGHEAGATMAGYHIFSSQSIELFRRSILISGAPWRLLPTDAEGKISSLSRNLLCTNERQTRAEDVVACLRKKSAESIVFNQRTPALGGALAAFAPTFNGRLTPRSLIVLPKQDHLFRNQKEILIGYTEDEGSAYTTALLAHYGVKHVSDLDINTGVLILNLYLKLHGATSYENVVNHYMKQAGRRPIESLQKAIGDFVVHCPMNIFAKSYASSGKDVYMYHFKHVPQYRWWPLWMGSPQMLDWFYISGNLLKLKDREVKVKDGDVKLSQKMASLLACFAETGNPEKCPRSPSINWKKLTEEQQYHLLVVNATTVIVENGLPFDKECKMWEEVLNGGPTEDLVTDHSDNKLNLASFVKGTDIQLRLAKPGAA